MKTLTVPVADDLYQRASEKAAAAETSLPKVVQDLLAEWTQEDLHALASASESQRRGDLLKFLDELAARPLKPGPSVGPLNREELYQRGVPGGRL
ncbi:MAG TPA: hypothetical protein VGX70_20735 [Gemmataceae bacterium]|jgi:hypothetical protein|nr:hypothetical protein [Gemmataceae bacterium]